MTGAAARDRQSLPEGSVETWPRGVSHVPEFSIGAVVNLVSGEFPATTVSKIRFLEEKGLLHPHRTASGYRKYSRADIERIRFILTQQRDSYAPLQVILEQMQALDAGHDIEPIPAARLVASAGKIVSATGQQSVTAREIRDLTGITEEALDEYVRLGLITANLEGRFPARTVRVVATLTQLSQAGMPPRLLRSVRQSAERSADIIDQAVMSRQNRERPGEKERRRAQASDLAELFSTLYTEFLSIGVDSLSDV